MSNVINICYADILRQVKLSCQIPSVIKEIVACKIITATANNVGIKVEPEELQKTADNIRLLNHLKSADETWLWLKENHLSIDDFEELAYTKAIAGKLAQHLFAEKVESWFVEHYLDYVGAVMYEVVLDDEDLAMELFYALQESEISFPEIANQYIQDKELRRTGGYRGVVRRKQLKAGISAAVFAAKPPQVLKPIITSKGAHLIFVEELIQPQLDNILRHQIAVDLFHTWIKQQTEQFQIVMDD